MRLSAVSLSGRARLYAVLLALIIGSLSMALRTLTADDALSPQALVNIDLSQAGAADVQVLGAGDNDHLSGNGTPGGLGELSRSRALAVGDFNGDGIQDVVMGAPDADVTVSTVLRGDSGAVYIIFGRTTPFLSVFDTSTDNPNITIQGASAGDRLGFAVAMGDVNGDTFDDLLIGAPGADFPGIPNTPRPTPIPDTGAVYVLLGSGTQINRTIDLATPDEADVIIYGIAGEDLFGNAIAVGNVGGVSTAPEAEQAISDIFVGASGSGGPAGDRVDAGAAFLLFGRSTLGKIAGATQLIDIGNSGTPANAVVFGGAGDFLGASLAIGDVNAVEPADIIVGSFGANRPEIQGIVTPADNTGATYAFFGGTNLNPLSGPTRVFDVSSATANQRPSVAIYGADIDDHSGASVAVGDVTGDGVADLIVGAPDADGPASAVRAASGEVYVIRGGVNLTPELGQTERRIDIVQPGAFLGVTVLGSAAGDRLGASVAVGSFNVSGNTDSILDLLMGAPGSGSERGAVSMLFGGPNLTLVSTRDLALGQDDVRVTGEAPDDELGWAIVTGDLDDNRGGDLIMGAPFADAVTASGTRTDSGKLFIILAADDVVPPPNLQPTVQLTAPNGDETLQGGSSFNINWTASDPNGDGTIQRFEIRLSTDSGDTFNTIINDNVAGSARTLQWTVPRINSTTVRVRIVVFDSGGLQSQDDSDGDFTITDPGVPVTLVTPNGGEDLRSGSTFEITWVVPVEFETQVLGFDLFLSTDSGATFNIGIRDDPIEPALPAGARSFDWTVPNNICTTAARVLVRATSILGSRSLDSSNADFSIAAPGPTINVNDMRLNNKRIDLRIIQPAVGAEIRFATDVQLQVATDATATQFGTFDRLKWKKSGRKLLSKGRLGGEKIRVFFPDGATRLIIVTNPPCGTTRLLVNRQGERLVLVTPAPGLE